MTRNTGSLTAALVFAAMAACGDEPPPKTAEDVPPPVKTSAKKADSKPETQSDIKIDNKIVTACGDLPTARFAFDSADVQPDAAAALEALARCFISGPLKGKSMKIIGHADPRGETEYNLALGQRRAGSVGGFLQNKGVAQGKLLTSSKGEFEASGTDEPGWALDRRVEIALGE
jgi:peptidoglycan-associated lipoprotein